MMIIGSGMIAKAFSTYAADERVLVFASGVANSRETVAAEYDRERVVLTAALRDHADKRFIYFSTCSVHDSDVSASPYVRHKLGMEALIRSMHRDHLILRLPQVVGRSENRATLVNYLYDKIMAAERFEVWAHAVRYLVDVEDVASIAAPLIGDRYLRNATIDVVSWRCTVPDIIKALEGITGKQARYVLVDRGTPYEVDGSYAAGIARTLGITFDATYLENLLKKYFSGR